MPPGKIIPQFLEYRSHFQETEGPSDFSGPFWLSTLAEDCKDGAKGELVGYFGLMFDPEWDSYLQEIYVGTLYRGQGYGKEMLRYAEGLARERGAKAMHLMVRLENFAARLYQGAGFRETGRRLLSKDLRNAP